MKLFHEEQLQNFNIRACMHGLSFNSTILNQILTLNSNMTRAMQELTQLHEQEGEDSTLSLEL